MPPPTTPKTKWDTPIRPLTHPLPLRLTASPTITAHAAIANAPATPPMKAAELVTHFLIGKHDMATIHMSPDPYNNAFEEELELRKYNYDTHHTAGFSFVETNGWNCLIYLASFCDLRPFKEYNKSLPGI